MHRRKYLQYGKAPTEPKALTKHIIGYLLSLGRLSYSYRNVAMSAIKHYYNSLDDDIILNWDKIAKYLGEEQKNELRAYTTEEIKAILDLADIKYKAIILLCFTMRREAVSQIKLEDMTYLPEHGLYKIKVYPKTSESYTTFCTPETAKAIDLYKSIEKPTTWLFPARKIVKGKHKHDGMHLHVSAISIYVGKLAERAGLRVTTDSVAHRNEIPAVHGLRHFAINRMKKAKVSPEIRKLLVGHTLGKTQDAYDETPDEDLLYEYLKAVPYLTIYDNVEQKPIESSKDNEIAQLKNQMAEMQTTLKIKYEHDMKAMREEMENKFQQILTRIDTGKLK